MMQRLKVVARCGTDSTMRHSAYAFMAADPDGDYVTLTDAEAEIARLTRERDEALAKVAAAFEASIAAIEGSRIVGGIVGPNDAGFEDGLSEAQAAIRALTPADATAALNRVRAGAMREAAGICAEDGSAWDWAECRDAILARADAVERGE